MGRSENLMVSYSQNYEDVLLWRLFQRQKSGFYVDVGAGHPVKDSVTRHFYLQGWNGINIEPNPKNFSLLKKDRARDINLPYAVSDQEGEAEFQFVSNDPNLSSLGKIPGELVSEHALKVQPHKVRVTTLSKIFEEQKVGKIDLLKIDVEGFEKQVLAGAALDRYPPRVIVIESVAPKGDQVVRDQWVDLLTRQDYLRVYFDGVNDYYVKSKDPEAVETFRLPLNANDRFIRAEFLKKKFLFRKLLGL